MARLFWLILAFSGLTSATTLIQSTFLDDYKQDINAETGWYIYDDHTGDKGNPLVVSSDTGKIYHGPTKRDVNQGYYQRKFMCAEKSKVTWSADLFYCSPSSSTSNTVHTFFNNQDFGNPFGFVLKNTGIPYTDQALIDATGCNNWEYKQIVEPNFNVDTGEPPVVEANEVFDFKFKFRLVGGGDYAVITNFRMQCNAVVEDHEATIATLTEQVNTLTASLSALKASLQVVEAQSTQTEAVANTAMTDIESIKGRLDTLENSATPSLSCNTYTRGFFQRTPLYCGDSSETMVSCNSLKGIETDSTGANYCSGAIALKAMCCKAE